MQAAFPEGISDEHLAEPPRSTMHANWLALLFLGAILAASFFGVFGGHRNDTLRQVANGVELSVSTPRTLRNGEFFEIRINLATMRALAAPAVAISAGSLQNLTINTTIPAPVGERFDEDAFVLEYDPLTPGETLAIKIDGQSNPTLVGGTRGRIEVRDGGAVLAAVPLNIRVLP